MDTRFQRTVLLALQASLLCLSPPPAGGQNLPTASSPGTTAPAGSRQRDQVANTLNLARKPSIRRLAQLITNRQANRQQRLQAFSMLRQLGPQAQAAVPGLTLALQDPDPEIRTAAVGTLLELGSTAQAAVPALMEALDDNDPAVRLQAVRALGRIGPGAKAAVPALADVIWDSNHLVRSAALYTLASIGPEAEAAVPELTKALQARDRELRIGATNALGSIGPKAESAVPALIQALRDSDQGVRLGALAAIGRLGETARAAIPELEATLQDPEKEVRSFAANALGRMGTHAKDAVPALVNRLQDGDKDVRISAVAALGRLALKPDVTIPALMHVLKTGDGEGRLSAALALSRIAGSLQDGADKLPSDELDGAIAQLSQALTLLEDSRTNSNEEVLAAVRRSFNALKIERDSRLVERLSEWVRQYPWLVGAIAYATILPSLWLTILWLRPLWLLSLNNALKPYTDFALPGPLGNSFKIPVPQVLFLSFFHYHPRVLDAWVARHLTQTQESFQKKQTVSERRVYISIPVVLDGNTVPELTAKELQAVFADRRQCVLIWGEGGIGKTSLACQIGRWAMHPDKTQRLCTHPMLPVLIEQELDLKVADGKQAFREAIRGQLQALIDATDPVSNELLERLLRQRRILVIVDHFSEMSEATRQEIRPGHPDFPANALVVTSRVEESLDGVPKTAAKPLRIEGNRLSSFLEAYLTQRQKRELFTDPEYFDACGQLSRMVGQRNITVLLAKLYAEQLIASKEGLGEGTLPDNIPDLMLSYLNELNRGSDPSELDNCTVHQDAKVVAWECLRQLYRPVPIKREVAIVALDEDPDKAKERLRHLEKRLRILQTVGPAEDYLRFALDPLAEYLAALYLVETCGSEEARWNNCLGQADGMPGAPDGIQGFLLAIRDCCLTKGMVAAVPEYVLEELGKRVGLSAEALRRGQIEQRIQRLIPLLQREEIPERLEAIRELGEIGSPAKLALPALLRAFQDPNWQIRREIARTIGQIGAEARSAIPALQECLLDGNRRVTGEIITTLGKLGIPAIPALINALSASHAHIRSSAAWVLGHFDQAANAAVPALTDALADTDWQVRWVAAYALGRIGPEAQAAVPALTEAVKGDYELVSKEASQALWNILGDEAAISVALRPAEESHGVKENPQV